MKYEMVDITGERFGKLVALKPDHRDNKRGWWWLCQCDCGNTKVVPSGNLRSGGTISCGCYKRGSEKFDYIGKRFGKLLVVSRAEDSFTPSHRKVIRYNCLCDCGNTKVVSSWHLKGGKIVSCGCYWDKRRVEANTKHGDCRTPLYNKWSCMKERCNDLDNPIYGGKGISVCDEWLGEDGYEHFKEWALNNGYKEGLTIDRIDNSKGYSPDNCRWATYKTQANNTSRNHYITINGETHTLSEWCEILNMNKGTVKSRIYKQKWNEIDALLTPINHH